VEGGGVKPDVADTKLQRSESLGGMQVFTLTHSPTKMTAQKVVDEPDAAASLVAMAFELAERVLAENGPGEVTHVAGSLVHIGNRWIRQRCEWCGHVLVDYDLERVAVPEGQDGPGGFAAGHMIQQDGGMSVDIGQPQPDTTFPDSMCWYANPAILELRDMNRAAKKAEAAERQRIHAMDNLLDECEVTTDEVGDHPHTMTVTHRKTGLSETSAMYGGELLTRNALLSKLNDKLKAAAEQGGEGSR
jgi:hypothetical protein